jgi:formylglycine-generating enzyme required for sulfatase activity
MALSELPEEKKAGRVYRLPTEAEWEYACRAGTDTTYSFGDGSEELSQHGWFNGNSGNRPHPVAIKLPNGWWLYDMHGNVWEWCSDWYGKYPKLAVNDPSGPTEGSYRVIRGGSWNFGAAVCRSAYRYWTAPSCRSYFYGFRVALSSSGIPKSREADK